MEFDFYYADIQVTVTLKSDKISPFGELTNNEQLTLQQIMYLALNTFLLSQSLYLSDDQQKGGD